MLMKRSVFLKRMVLFAAVVTLAIVAGVMVQRAGTRHRRAMSTRMKVRDSVVRFRMHASEIRRECALVVAEPERIGSALEARLSELLDEADATLSRLGRVAARLDVDDGEFRRLARDFSLCANVVKAPGVPTLAQMTELKEETSTLLEEVLRIGGEMEGVAGMIVHDARRSTRLALGFLIITGALGLVGAASAVSDAMNEVFSDFDLDNELHRIEAQKPFQERINALSGDASGGRWRLVLTRTIHAHRTHFTFEAVARRGEASVRLWGKCYRWTGVIKGLQRIFWPAYGLATWQALNIMHLNGLRSARPVFLSKIRRRPFTVGLVVMAEHVGVVSSVQSFLDNRFDLLGEQERSAFLDHLATWWNRLHGCGICGISLRYLHAAHLSSSSPDETIFHLFDLDKVWISRSPLALSHRMRVQQDNRRLLVRLRPLLTGPEYARLAHTLAMVPT